MTTSEKSPASTTPREPLRLSFSATDSAGGDNFDGAWWPQSRDLDVELADLIDNFPAEHGFVVRAGFSPPDWDTTPRRVPVARGYVKVGSFPHDDTHLVDLRMLNRTALRLLVVPSSMSADQGAEAMLAASTPGNDHDARGVLDLAGEDPDVDPGDQWQRDGGMK